MTAITALNVRLGMDVSDFAEGANLARAETNRVAAIMRQSEPAAKKYQRDLDLLNRSFSETGKQGKDYANALEFLKNKYNQATPSTSKATQAVDQLKQSMMSAVPGGNMLANALKGPAGAALAAAAAIGVLAKGLKDAAARIDETAKAAKTAGMAYADLVAVQMLASESAGVDASTINRGMREMSKRLAEARVEGGKLADQLKAVGIDVDELASKDPAEQFRIIADVIAGTPDKAEQLRIATLAAGRAGAELVEVFRQGGQALDDARKEAERLGTVLDDEAVASIEAMNDAFGRSGMAVQGIFNSMLSGLAPTLTKVAKTTEEFFVLVRQTGEALAPFNPVLQGVMFLVNKMLDGFRFIIALISDAVSMLKSIPSFFGGGKFDTSLSATNRLLDEMDAKANGMADAKKRAADEAEALAIKAMKAAEEAEKLEQRYEDQVKQLQIQSLELAGHAELAREQQLLAQGYTKEQTKSLMAMEKQNDAIKEKVASQAKLAQFEQKFEDRIRQLQIESVKLAENSDLAREMQLAAEGYTNEQIKTLTAMEKQNAAMKKRIDDEKKARQEALETVKAVEKHFEQERQRDMQRRRDVAAGPGSGMEAGSAEAARFMADQINQAIGVAAVPEKPTPGEKEIADKTQELLIAQHAANAKQDQQIAKAEALLQELKNNGFKRIR